MKVFVSLDRKLHQSSSAGAELLLPAGTTSLTGPEPRGSEGSGFILIFNLKFF